MALGERGYSLLRLDPFPESIRTSFDHLPADPYCKDRYRRFSQYRLGLRDGDPRLELLPHRPLIQHKQHNSYMGGVLRHLQPLTVDVSDAVRTVAAAIPLDRIMDWQVDVHQWRTTCGPEEASPSVPEGPHQDGHEYAAILVVRRRNITGGSTILYTLEDRAPFFERTLEEGEAIVIDDRGMLHFTTEIQATKDAGMRDIFVITMSRWEDRRYGAEFEAAALTPPHSLAEAAH